MGWWSAPDAQNIEIGDEILDMVRNFLRDFSETYQKEIKRKPTFEEFQYAVNLSFKINLNNDIVSGLDELEVKQVTFKTGKIAKRTKVKPGDIFAFRIDSRRFGFGRIVSLISVGAVIELFDFISEQPIFDYSKIDTWLLPPTTLNTYSVFEAKTEGDWRVVGETKNFSPGQKYKNVRFIYGHESDGFFTAVDIFDKESKATLAEGKKYPHYSVRDDQDIKNLVLDIIGK